MTARDPYNTWLGKQNRLRVEAEIVRDLALAASGLLNAQVGGPSVRPPQPKDVSAITYSNSASWEEDTGPNRYRRGLYVWFQRTSPYPSLMVFDAPESYLSCVRRERSNTPLQALTLLNDVAFVECAQALGRKMTDLSPTGDADIPNEARIEHIFRSCLTRPPSSREMQTLMALYEQMRVHYQKNTTSAQQSTAIDEPDQHYAVELAACTAVARTVLNLDEFITRE